MNLWLRLLWLLTAAGFRSKLNPHDGVSRLRMRVWPNDLDLNMHLNNGRYWSIFDLGRMDLAYRTGVLGAMRENGWIPIIGAGSIRYRGEMRLWQTFILETRVAGWEGSKQIYEQRIILSNKHGEQVVATRGFLVGAFYDRKKRRFVPTEEMLELIGANPITPPLDAAARALLEMEDLLKLEPLASEQSAVAGLSQ